MVHRCSRSSKDNSQNWLRGRMIGHPHSRGQNIHGFPAAIFPHESLEQRNLSPKNRLKAFKIFWGDLKIPLKIASEHIPSLSNTSNQKTPFIKPQFVLLRPHQFVQLETLVEQARWVLPMVVTPVVFGSLDEAKKEFIQHVFNRW